MTKLRPVILNMARKESASVKSHIFAFIRNVFGKKYRIQIDTRNEVGLDLFEEAMLDVHIAPNAEPLYDRYALDNNLFHRIFLRMMMGFVCGYLVASFRKGHKEATIKEAIGEYYDFCGISELQYPYDNAIKSWTRNGPRERLEAVTKGRERKTSMSFTIQEKPDDFAA